MGLEVQIWQHFEVHQVLCLPRNLHFEVHQAPCLPRNLHFEVHQALCLPRNLHFKVHQVLRLLRNLHIKGCACRNLQTSFVSKSHDSLHLSRNLSSSTITTMSKVLHLPRKLHFEVKQHRSLAPVAKSRPFSNKTRGFPCPCHEK